MISNFYKLWRFNLSLLQLKFLRKVFFVTWKQRRLQSARTAKIIVAINILFYFRLATLNISKQHFIHTTGWNMVDITSKVVCSGQQDSFIEIQVVFFLKLYTLRHPNDILHRKSNFLIILLKFSARNISYLKEEKTLFVCPIFCKRWCTQRCSTHSDEVRTAMMYAQRCCPKGLTFNDTDFWNPHTPMFYM